MPAGTVTNESDFYGSVSGVETWLRNKDFTPSTDITDTEVEDLLKDVSDEIDKRTGKAWRERTVTDYVTSPSISASQKKYYKRGRPPTSPAGFMEPIDPWALVNVPNRYLRDLDPAEGDTFEVLLPRSAEDITANEGRADGDFWLDGKSGKLYVDVGNFSVGPIRGGGMIKNPKVRLTYRYGKEFTTGDTDGDGVPERVNRCANKWVAADLINTDSMGATIPSAASDNVPDMTTGASELFSSAMSIIDGERSKPIL